MLADLLALLLPPKSVKTESDEVIRRKALAELAAAHQERITKVPEQRAAADKARAKVKAAREAFDSAVEEERQAEMLYMNCSYALDVRIGRAERSLLATADPIIDQVIAHLREAEQDMMSGPGGWGTVWERKNPFTDLSRVFANTYPEAEQKLTAIRKALRAVETLKLEFLGPAEVRAKAKEIVCSIDAPLPAA